MVEGMTAMQQGLAEATRKYQDAVEDLGASQEAVAEAAMGLAMAQRKAFQASKAVLGATGDGFPPDDYITVGAVDDPLGLSGNVPISSALVDVPAAGDDVSLPSALVEIKGAPDDDSADEEAEQDGSSGNEVATEALDSAAVEVKKEEEEPEKFTVDEADAAEEVGASTLSADHKLLRWRAFLPTLFAPFCCGFDRC